MPAASDNSAPAPRGAWAAHLLAALGLVLFAYVLLTATADNDTWYHPRERDGDPDGGAIASLAATFFVAAPVIVLTYAVALIVSHLTRGKHSQRPQANAQQSQAQEGEHST